MLPPWQKCSVVRIINETNIIRRFFLQIEGPDTFSFQAGQFVTLDLPIHEDKHKRWRSYSIASPPTKDNIIELIIVLLERGEGTHYLFDKVKVGDVLPIRGPQGKFLLPSIIDKDIFFICTGTGVAPFRSMLQVIKNNCIVHRRLYLIFGCRYLSDQLYKDDFTQLVQELPLFMYIPVFSREQAIALPTGSYSGYVHVAYKNILQKEKEPAYFYLCGWKDMIDEAKQNIISMGYTSKDICLELYG